MRRKRGGEESETLKKRINLSVYKPFTVTYLVRPVQSSPLLSALPILRLTCSLRQSVALSLSLLSFPRPFLPSFWPRGMSNHMSDEIDTKLAVKAADPLPPPSSCTLFLRAEIVPGSQVGRVGDMIKLQNGGGLGAS